MQQIPSRLNTVLVFMVIMGALSLLWFASRLPLIWSIPIGIVFSFLLLTNYALMHEGAHQILHQNSKFNNLMGALSSFLFPMSFTLFSVSHAVHHRGNRTDYEMFDYYYPGDNKFIKYAQWYSILIGIYWPIIPLGSILMAVVPGIYRTRPFTRARTTAILFKDFGKEEIRMVRWEVFTCIVFWILIWNLLDLRWQSVLILYVFFSFNWSTRQYVTHAFTPRDVINGALNLKVSRITGWILLNGHWDLVHHQHPRISWLFLPKFGESSRQPVSFWSQYFRLWKGPRPNQEAAPEILAEDPV